MALRGLTIGSLTLVSAAAVVVWTKEERKQLQRVENRICRQILGAPVYTPVAALQREIGASSVEGMEKVE